MITLAEINSTFIDDCYRRFHEVYPEFHPKFLGGSKDKSFVVAECTFPDGIYYFRLTDHSVSHAYNTKEQAFDV